ncbi:Arfaptin (AH) domain/BAR domain [Trinorchestia longiramus]|nr:Arfaptin (AH) domain/BAR domain [Trinorchestia longiramus]
MKSLRDSFSMWSNKSPNSVLGPMPKSAVGFVPHKEEQQLTKLWSDMLKCEQGCQDTIVAVRQYTEKSMAVQQHDQKLLTKLQETCDHQTSLEYHNALKALDNLLPELGESTKESCERLENDVSAAARDYHAVYAAVDALRIKRDGLVTELNRIQDKIEKLRLKGKRSTDVLVEKERTLKQLQEVQSSLLTEASVFHQLRTTYFLDALHSYADAQFLLYGGQVQHYKTHVVSSPVHRPNLSCLQRNTSDHLAKLAALNITDSS